MYGPRAENVEWFETLMASLRDPFARSPVGELLPAFPDEVVQMATTSLSGESAMRQAFAFYEDLMDAIVLSGSQITPGFQILDFGSCWGRIARLFMRHVPKAQISGVDVDETFNLLACDLFGCETFRTCGPRPPLDVADRSLDLVTSYSVFSHLAEQVALEWVEEFSRVLRPGGYLAFTTRHESFFDYLVSLVADTSSEGYRKALGRMFSDLPGARTRYSAGEFIFSNSPGVTGGGPRDGSYYGEAFIPKLYVEHTYTRWFDLVASKHDPSRYDQMLFVLRNR